MKTLSLLLLLFISIFEICWSLPPTIKELPTNVNLKSYMKYGDLCSQKFYLLLSDAPILEPTFRDPVDSSIIISVLSNFRNGSSADYYLLIEAMKIGVTEGTVPINLLVEYSDSSSYNLGQIISLDCKLPPSQITVTPLSGNTLQIPRITPENNMMVYSIVVENFDRDIGYIESDITCSEPFYCTVHGSSVFNQFDIFIDINTSPLPIPTLPTTIVVNFLNTYTFNILNPFNSSYITPTTTSTQTLTAVTAPLIPNYYYVNTELAPIKPYSFMGFTSTHRQLLSDLNFMIFYQSNVKNGYLAWNHMTRDRDTSYQGFTLDNMNLVNTYNDAVNYPAFIYPSIHAKPINSYVSKIGNYYYFTVTITNMYNPKMLPLTSVIHNQVNYLYFFEYPFGITIGRPNFYTYSFSYMISKFYSEHGTMFGVGYFTAAQMNTAAGQVPTSLTPDTEPPVITNITYQPMENGRVHIVVKAIDNVSGVANIFFRDIIENQITFMTLEHLVAGTINDGSFELVVDKLVYSTVSQVLIQDAAGNSVVYYASQLLTDPSRPFYMSSLGLLSDFVQPLFTKDYLGLTNINQITTLSFSENNLNLLQPKNITLNLAFKDSDPMITPYIKLYFSKAPRYVDDIFYGTWNTIKKVYEIIITVPSHLPSGAVEYNLFIPRDGNFTNTQLTQAFGDSVNLYINSESSYQLPPVFESVVIPSNVMIEDGTTNGYSYEFTISAEYNFGLFLDGEIRVRSEFDINGKNFIFTKEDLDVNNKIILNFPIDSTRCNLQTYQISYVKLRDSNGYYSLLDYDDTLDQIDPFLFIADKNKNTTIACRTTVPMGGLTLFAVGAFKSKSVINVASMKDSDRTLDVDLYYKVNSIERVSNPGYGPVVYFTTPRIDILSAPSTVVETFPANDTIHIRSTIIVPIGYAYPESFSFSMYGISDVSYSYVSMNISSFGNMEVQTTFTLNMPSLNGTSSISNRGGVLSLYGHRFGSDQSNTQIHYRYVDGDGMWMVNTNPFTYFSGLIVATTFPASNSSFHVLVQVDMDQTNEILVVPYEYIEPSSSEGPSSSSSSSSTSSSSTSTTGSSSSLPENNSSEGNNNNNGICYGDPICGGPEKGTCISPLKGCQCFYPYTGIDCNSIIIIIPQPPVNPTQPNTSLDFNTTLPNGENVKYSSLVSVVSLREYSDDRIVKEYNFDKWILTNISNTEFIYSATINQDTPLPTFVNVTIRWFEKEQNITFAKEILNMKPSSMKYLVNISQYSFESSVNYLQLVMYASIQSDNNDNLICSSKEYFSSTNDQTQYEYINLQVDSHSLVGRFIKRGMIDGRPRSTTNVFLDSNKNPMTISSSQAYIGINIPYFKNLVELDPDFSVLIDNKPASESDSDLKTCQSSKKSSLTGAQIAGIVIGSVGFAAVIGISLTYYFYKKRQQSLMVKNMQAHFNNIDNTKL